MVMNYDSLKQTLLSYPGSSLDFPFDETTAVFKVANKMFALVSLEQNPLRMNLKCAPEDALILRSQFKAIIPGYHMNKDHWNTLILDETLSEDLINTLVDDSYSLVLKTLPKRVRDNL